MFKKTRVRQIIELLQKNLSDREVSTVLGVSRNSVARIRQASDGCNGEWEELLTMTDDELYRFFYPDKFKPKQSYASVDYAYVHKELSKVGVTEVLLWEEYCEKCKKEGAKACSYPTFARGYKRYTVSKNYTSHIKHKPGVTLEVDWSGPTMNYIDQDKNTQCTAYLFVATFPYSQYTYVEAAASMNQSDWLYCNVHMLEFFEGSPVKIVCDNLKTGVIAHPKHGEIVLNDAYLSFAEHYQIAIMPAEVRKPKQKPMLRALPLLPFEICEWSYHHKVGPNSHIWFGKGQYSVPSDYLNQYVDVRYNNAMVSIYSSHKLIAEHKRLPSGLKNGKRTEASHLPYPLYTPETVESTIAKAEEIGTNTTTVIGRIYENAKIKEQALMDARSVLDIASIYGEKILEEACRRALKDFHMITYNTLIAYIKDISKSKKNKMNSENGKVHQRGIVRGADYYRKDGRK